MLTRELAHLERHRPGTASKRVGLALSGGGVRSATICLGFLKEVVRLGVMPQVDYVSSVSGGGYASGYLYSAAHTFQDVMDNDGGVDHSLLFEGRARRELVSAGKYLATGTRWATFFGGARLLAATVNTAALNMLWVGSFVAALACGAALAVRHETRVVALSLAFLAAIACSRLLLAVVRGKSRLWLSKVINELEGLALVTAVLASVVTLGLWLGTWSPVEAPAAFGEKVSHTALFGVAVFLIVGFFVTPDAIGLNAVFRNLIDSAYLNASWRVRRAMAMCSEDRAPPALRLADLADPAMLKRLPYPLFNCCLYYQDERDDTAAGARMIDYFLLSPLHCGASVTGYAKLDQDESRYGGLMLGDAIAVSAASITPLMDGQTNGFLSLVMSALNLNLGVWFPTPGRPSRRTLPRFWPGEYLRMMFGRLNAKRDLVQVADGGFIDNLGIFELLRRRCPVIIALDNTYDPHYEFKHLRLLLVRARNELGVTIDFEENPEDVLRPAVHTGFSRAHFVRAKIGTLAGKTPAWKGVLIYCKACVTPSHVWRDPKYQDPSCSYKTHHPRFPQESTADQFFDEAQWEAYFALGSQMASSVLGPGSRSNVTVRAPAAKAVYTEHFTSRAEDAAAAPCR
jgi:hypothetical protein